MIAIQTAFATLPTDPDASNGDIVSGKPFATQPILEARDANGNVDVDLAGIAAISIESGGASLAGTTTQPWSNGRATFDNLAVSHPTDGTPFTLQASANELAVAITAPLTSDVVASQLVYVQEIGHNSVPNGDILSGVAFQTQPIVEAQDASGALDLHF